jgi:hypothetical protein
MLHGNLLSIWLVVRRLVPKQSLAHMSKNLTMIIALDINATRNYQAHNELSATNKTIMIAGRLLLCTFVAPLLYREVRRRYLLVSCKTITLFPKGPYPSHVTIPFLPSCEEIMH